MAKRFQQKVIEDARKAGSPYPTNIRKELKNQSFFVIYFFRFFQTLQSQPHYHNPYSTWPKLPTLRFRTNDSSLLRNFQKS